MTPDHHSMIYPAEPGNNPIIFKGSPQYTARYGRCPTRLGSKSDSDEEESTIDSGDDEIAEETEATNDDEATTITKNGLRDNMVNDFLYGANYVHSQYLSILWRYSIVKTFKITVPIAIALWMNHGFYDFFFGISRSVLYLSSIAASVLQLPLVLAQQFVLSGWNVSPEALASAIMFLPNFLAIPLVELLLWTRASVMFLVGICSGNNAIRFLSSLAAILIWRPAVEEWQYRSVLNKVSFGAPRWMLARGKELSPNTAAVLRKIKKDFNGIVNKSAAMVVEELESKSTTTNSTKADEDIDDLAPFLPDLSTRILTGSILFATTRLGWLSVDPGDSVALSNSPYGFTIGFLSSIGSLFTGGGSASKDLRILILLLAIHQTISTFYIAQYVFAGIYKRKGLVASIGAHVSWTVGKGTIPFRLGWKFWQGAYANLAVVSYGSSEEKSDESTSSEGDDGVVVA